MVATLDLKISCYSWRLCWGRLTLGFRFYFRGFLFFLFIAFIYFIVFIYLLSIFIIIIYLLRGGNFHLKKNILNITLRKKVRLLA